MKVRKILGITMAFIMMINNINIATAKEQAIGNLPAMEGKDVSAVKIYNLDAEIYTIVYSFDLGNGAKIRVKEDGNKRIAEYYANNINKQTAILNKSTGDIYYYDLSLQATPLSIQSVDENLFSESNVQIYNINDFLLNHAVNDCNSLSANQAAANNDDNFHFLKSKEVTIPGETYQRELYGYTDSKQYRQNSWHFPANTAVSVIAAACGFLPQVGIALSLVATAAGLVLSAFTVQEWVKELFWVYKFMQTSPTKMEFVCSGEFMYEKQHKVEINGDIGYWETLETKSDREIERIRDDILTYPGYYI